MDYPHLFEPLRLRGVTLPNRLVMAPMSSKLASPEGVPTTAQIAYYVERARGGVGMVTVEYACIERSLGRAYANQLGLDDEAQVGEHARLARAIAAEGAIPGIQLHHSGRQTTPAGLGGRQPVAPSAVVSSADESTVCRPLAGEEIEDLVRRFARSAAWAVAAGYRYVELHGAHGYLLHQFLSPATNLRDDEWGGDFERRLRFPLEVVRAIRHAIGAQVPLGYRLSASEFLEGGMDVEHMARVAQRLAGAGVDLVNVSSGIRRSLQYTVDPMSMQEGWRVPLAARIREAVPGVPVMATGPFRHPHIADAAVAQGQVDLVALGRALLADPEWPAKARAGQAEGIRPCTSCNYCVGAPRIRCAENPRAGRELDPPVTATGRGRVAAVVGAGPGGIAAALLLEEAGYAVHLFEMRSEVGGGLLASGAPPHKDKLLWYLDYLRRMLERSKVSVQLGVCAGEAEILRTGAEFVIVACGASENPPGFGRHPGASVLSAYELLMQPSEEAPGPCNVLPTIVYGGGETGCETAEYLAARGVEVTLVTRSPAAQLARGAEMLYRRELLPRLLANPRIHVRDGTMLCLVCPGEARVLDAHGEHALACGAAVTAQGRRPDGALLQQLRTSGMRCVAIGDARQVGRIGDAVAHAYEAVRALA